ncbi:MAG TPA: ATP-binding cassette domain-containing protein [Solirubrobacteraceae bacterium]|jgi:ABC-type Mn2+/Zn2+ transport system ATPase subunit
MDHSPALEARTGIDADATAVELIGASKRYSARGRWILSDVSVAVRQGALIEIRGANGSGKSTLLRLLAGATVPTRGRRAAASRGRVGYAPERLAPPLPFAADDYLRQHARLRRLPDWVGRDAINSLSERLAVRGLLGERLGALSKGSLQKIVLIQALLGAPTLLVLDEPFSGLDVEARGALGVLLRERVSAGSAVVFSDHRAGGSQLSADVRWLVAEAAVHAQSSSSLPLDVAALPGVLDARREGPVLSLCVAAESSDAALSALLERGWHIESVTGGQNCALIEARSE